jgi:hypothetical protein
MVRIEEILVFVVGDRLAVDLADYFFVYVKRTDLGASRKAGHRNNHRKRKTNDPFYHFHILTS